MPLAESGRPEQALERVERLDLEGCRYLDSTGGELLTRQGRRDAARAAYERALELPGSEPERRFLPQRIAPL